MRQYFLFLLFYFQLFNFIYSFTIKLHGFLGEFIDFVHIDDARNIDNVRETIRFYSRM